MNMNDRPTIEYNPPATGMKLRKETDYGTHDDLNIWTTNDSTVWGVNVGNGSLHEERIFHFFAQTQPQICPLQLEFERGRVPDCL